MNMTSTQKVNKFFEKYPQLKFKPGQLILHPGKEVNQIYYLKSGAVKMYLNSKSGDEVNLHVFQANSFFPIMLSLESVPNKYYFETMLDCEVYVAPTAEVIA